MVRIKRELRPSVEPDLERLVEPLASYICATSEPRAALVSALAVLFREMEQTNRAARVHIHTLAEKC